MKKECYPIIIKSENYTYDTVKCMGTVNNYTKKEGFNKSKTLYGETLIFNISLGNYAEIIVSYIEETDFNYLKLFWSNQGKVEIQGSNNNIILGTIVNEDMNWTSALNQDTNTYYFTGTLSVED